MKRKIPETMPEQPAHVSLSTKVTVIVFWGLIIAGLVFATLLLQNRETETRESRDALADSLAYQVDQLFHGHAANAAEVTLLLTRLLEARPEVGVVLKTGEQETVRVGTQNPGENSGADPQVLTRQVNIQAAGRDNLYKELAVSFPNIERTLHAERSRLLLTLGVLLLLFGVVLKGLLERILTLPMAQMVRAARAISEGRSELSFDTGRQDEFGYLAKFINRALEGMRESEREAQRSRELAEVTLHSIGDAVITTNRNGRVVYMNPVAQRLLKLNIEDARGQFLQDIMPLVDEETDAPLQHPILDCLRENRTVELDAECALLLASGVRVPISDSAAPIRDATGAVRGAVMVFHDVSEARRLQRELSFQASHDPLTGLYNRREFDREVQRALERAERDGCRHALCYLDLDQFKVVNDTCGHAAGDQLLHKLTAYLQSKLRKADVLARLGGDEFGLLLAHCPLHRALDVAESLREAVSEFRFQWQDKSFQIGVSIGLVELSPTVASAAEALAAADMACYAAKEDGRNRIHVYHPDDVELTRRREEMGMVTAVQRALTDDSLELFGQIIAPVREETTLPHYEILVRMRDPEGHFISPGAFIPAAERFQLMSSLDRWVVSHSLRFAAAQARGGNPIELSINLSGQSLSEDQFLDFVIREIDQSGVTPEHLCFEITETAAINNLARAVRFMTSIRRLGCHFALDDFGSGMSSFGYLKNLPVDVLKIDGGFIKRLHESPVDQSMVRAIQEVARLMNMKTVAEFVENAEILHVLRDIGIDRAQGYFLGKPAPLTELFPAGVQTTAMIAVPPQLKLVRS
ncbi:MAG: EAL domain-containing protein [Gammaproteobacteria bacterium]|nr:EAL domain-containing protein [Gammaproteobacteria bacterium]